MRKRTYLLIIVIFLSIHFISANDTNSPVDYVNVLTGTLSKYELSNGNTYPAIARPWGMNFWTPQTGKMGDGWIYRYDADKLIGFRQTHQPSPWMNDYGQFSIMPTVGKIIFNEKERGSWFSHKAEIAKPYYYSVYLVDYDVTTEVTPTCRAAVFRFTFPESNQSNIIIDAFDKGSSVKVIPEKNAIIGYTTRNSGGVPSNFKNYFVIIFDKSFKHYHDVRNGEISLEKAENFKSEHSGAIISFQTKSKEQITAKVASSFISYEQAWQNLKEVSKKSFNQVKKEGEKEWNNILGRIEINDPNIDNKRTFYSNLYRSTLFPRKFYEINKSGDIIHYSPYNGKVLPGYMYTDTGFWDTFRALFPLLNLVYPSVNQEIQKGLINAYKESGFLPEWASPGHRGIMIGNNSASVVADAYLKGLRGYDINTLYEALLHGANNVHPKVSATGRLGHKYYNTLGYVPYDVNINENAARTLEYAYDDWTIYQLAKSLKRPKAEIDLYAKRCQNYRNLFSKEYNLMRGRNKNGEFQSPFNPKKWGDTFTEGNSWHYTWSVFHDIQGLIDLMGGERTFVNMLDSVFKMSPDFDDTYYGFPIHEIREMQIMNMGQYAHGNQPIQHMIYLYNYAGEPWKSQYWVREVMNKLYSSSPDGYCGDEDNGQTSAWYVFSALGFYPVCPGSKEYVIGSPIFEKAIITLENGKTLKINTANNNLQNRYIKNIYIKNKKYNKNFFTHDQLIKGGSINFNMTSSPNKKRGINKEDYPYSYSKKQ